jgi:hypothetical protein
MKSQETHRHDRNNAYEATDPSLQLVGVLSLNHLAAFLLGFEPSMERS